MNRDEIFEKVRDILAEMFEIDPATVKLESQLVQDLDLDSIDAIDMVVKLQELTGKRVEEAKLRKVRTVGDVVDLVESHLGES
ncbi:MAG: acyl carrier protein [Deltaproteobacteria bacterium]|nr:acyl carrier protein [Deltaproteobacteria bacterium]